MSLGYRKIYIDTRFKNPESVSNSDFVFELDSSLNCHPGPFFTCLQFQSHIVGQQLNHH
jgi:hypothetical protein